MSVTSVVVPQGIAIVTASQGGTQVPASGGSIINFGSTTVYVVSKPDEIGVLANAAPIVQGAALPWPNGVTCYAWVLSGRGSLYVTPVNTSAYPTAQIVTDNVGDPDAEGQIPIFGSYSGLPYPQTDIMTLGSSLLRTIDIAHITIATTGQYSGVHLFIIGKQSGKVYVNAALNGNTGTPTNINKSFPRGINMGDSILQLKIVEDGATILTWTGSISLSATTT